MKSSNVYIRQDWMHYHIIFEVVPVVEIDLISRNKFDDLKLR